MISSLLVRKGNIKGRSFRLKSINRLTVYTQTPTVDVRIIEFANRARKETPAVDQSQIVEGWLHEWKSVGVLSGKQGLDGYEKKYSARFWELEPGDRGGEPVIVAFDTFFVVGFFRVVEVVNNAKMAKAAWEDFVPR